MLGLRILEGVIIVQAQACNLDFSDTLGQPTSRSTKTQYILKNFRASRNTNPDDMSHSISHEVSQ